MRFWPISTTVDSKSLRVHMIVARTLSSRRNRGLGPIERIFGCKSKTAADEAAAVCTDQNLTWKHYTTWAGAGPGKLLGGSEPVSDYRVHQELQQKSL